MTRDITTTPHQNTDDLTQYGAGHRIGPDTITGHYAGDPLQLGYTVAGLIATERRSHNPDNHIAADSGFRPDITEATYDFWFR